jgi:hypothetical protein
MLLVAGLYLGFYLTRGWYPHDEGALGQMAERVLGGEMPHRDFDEPYTGLLTYLHAAAFGLGGIRLAVLRVPLFITTLAWLAAVFAIARRSASPRGACAVALVALAWSVPNYPASMPSWYNLFCATFGLLALLRWDETRASPWLVLAGIAGGVSFLFKLSGLFFVAGALLYLVFATRADDVEAHPPGKPEALSAVFITASLTLFVMMLWRGIAPHHVPRAIIHFVAPAALLALGLSFREWSRLAGSGRRLRSLVAAGLPFLLGVAIPIGVFVLGFALAGAVPELIHGVFVAPFRRAEFANMTPPAAHWLLAIVPLAILLRPRADHTHSRWGRAAVLVALLLGVVVWLASTESFVHRMVWQSVRNLVPVIALVAAGVLVWPRLSVTWDAGARRRFVLMVAITVPASLIQYPFSSPTYFLYVAPLVLLVVLALVQAHGRTPQALAGVTLAFYGAFAVLLATPGAVVGLAFRYEAAHPTVPLELPRSGLRVNPDDAALYGALIPRVRARAGNGGIWAGPDAPEIYFLAGYANRTRAIFDFLGDSDSMAAGIMARDDVRAVVLNTRPAFSRPIASRVLDMARSRFPFGERIGRFELRWRQ